MELHDTSSRDATSIATAEWTPEHRTTISFLTALLIMVFMALYAPSANAGVFSQAVRSALHRKKPPPPPAQMITKPAPPPPVFAPGKPHDVVISRSRHPEAARHIDQAQRQGQPSVLHLDRAHAHERRRQSTGSVDPHRKPSPLHERDEYPPALTREGGANANVRYIPRADNRGAGGSLRAQTRGLPDGSKIRIVVGD